jgi:hypothetical protein
MAIEISSNSVVKIVVRRGPDSDRRVTLLSNGELGYSQDLQRLYIGNGITSGGIPVGNLFFGTVPTRAAYLNQAEEGDTIFDTTTKTLYGLDSGVWKNIHPSFQTNVFEQSLNGTWNLSPDAFADAFTFDPAYEPLSVAGIPNRIDFNSNFLSLCAAFGSMYFGDIKTRTVRNNFDATVNVNKSLYINADTANPNQIQILARNSSNNSSVRGVSGNMDIGGRNNLYLTTDSKNAQQIDGSQNVFMLKTGGTYNSPNFRVDGISRFQSDSYFDDNLTVYGNLSVFGDLSYLETVISTTSAVQIINKNKNAIALQVSQLDNAANQTLAQFNSDTGNPVMQIKDGPYVGINALSTETSSTANFSVNGKTLFTTNNSTFTINAGTGSMNLNGDINIGGVVDFTTVPVANTTSSSILVLNANNEIEQRSINASVWGGNYLQGTLTDNYVTKKIAGTANTLTNSQIFDNGTGVGIGTVTPGIYKLNVNGSFNSTSINTAAVVCTSVNTTNGNITMGTGDITCQNINATGDIVAFSSSDRKLKHNIKPIINPLEKIKQISGVNFVWDDKLQSIHTGNDIGVLAQEIEAVLPEAVTTRDDGYKAVRYEKIIPLLIEAIKELSLKLNNNK